MIQARLMVRGTSFGGGGGTRCLRVVRQRRVLGYTKNSDFSFATDELHHLGKVTVP